MEMNRMNRSNTFHQVFDQGLSKMAVQIQAGFVPKL
jgi:hypothetical protein